MTNDETSGEIPSHTTEPESVSEKPKTAGELVQALLDVGLTPDEIAKRSGNRVSRRTIYRWLKGEVGTPKQEQNLKALKRLLKRVERKNNDNINNT